MGFVNQNWHRQLLMIFWWKVPVPVAGKKPWNYIKTQNWNTPKQKNLHALLKPPRMSYPLNQFAHRNFMSKLSKSTSDKKKIFELSSNHFVASRIFTQMAVSSVTERLNLIFMEGLKSPAPLSTQVHILFSMPMRTRILIFSTILFLIFLTLPFTK